MEEEPEPRPTLQKERRNKRDRGGKFMSTSPFNRKTIRRAMQQRRHLEKRKTVQNECFNDYLSCFVRPGKEDDSIPAGRSRTPLTRIYEGVVREEFRLGPNVRFASLKNFYLEGGFLHPTSNIFSKYVPARPTRYEGYRLPLLKYKSEMTAVRKLVEKLFAQHALIQTSVEDAIHFIKQELRNCQRKNVNDSVQVRRVQAGSLGDSTGTQVTITGADGAACLNDGRINHPEARPSTEITQVTVDLLPPLDITHPMQGDEEFDSDVQLADGDTALKRRARVLFEMARNTTLYWMLHSVLDQSLEFDFGLFAKQCRDELAGLQVQPSELLEDILKYVRGKRSGVGNPSVHASREKRLQATAVVLDKIRSCIATKEKPLPLYKDMTWGFEE